MFLRICLALSILAGLGVIALTHFQVRPHVQQIIDHRNTYSNNWQTAETKARKLDKDLKATTARLQDTEKKLTETEAARVALDGQLTEERKRSTKLTEELQASSQKVTGLDQELSAWKALGLDASQIRALIDSEKGLRAANEALIAENRLFLSRIRLLTNQLAQLLGEQGVSPPLKPGTKGRVMVVDPKWDFVVLDLGEKDELVPNGILIVHRHGKLVAKIKIVSVQKDRSIANIMPGWKLGEVMEGDAVFY